MVMLHYDWTGTLSIWVMSIISLSLFCSALGMDRHRSRSPPTGYHHQSAYRRERDNDRRNHGDSTPFRSPNQHQYQSRSTTAQNPLSSQTLSTRKELYERDFPLYKQPVEVGCFSLDSQRRFFNDDRQMRFYVEPDKSPNFDLRDGYKDRYVKRDENVKERLDHILKWIITNMSKLKSKGTANSSR